jgi:hypothetical protein
MSQTIADDLIYIQVQNEVVFIKYLSPVQAETTDTKSGIPLAGLARAQGCS